MGGKSYYCDYCNCFMKNDINVRKSHNIGIPHKIAKANYMAKYKDPQQIIIDEEKKIPCKRFLNNKECQFGFFCHFSHYSPELLAYLQAIVHKSQYTDEYEKIIQTKSTLWKHPKAKDHLQLPPSLQRMDFDKITESCFVDQWG